MLEHSRVGSMDELLAKKKYSAETVESAMNEFFKGLNMSNSDIDTWPEKAVNWH